MHNPRMKLNLIALLSLFPLLFTKPVLAQDLPPYSATVVVEFERSKVTGQWAEGYADSDTKRLVTVDDPVRIASISKLILAMGVDKLVKAKKINLKKDVSEYLGWQLRNPAYPTTPITLDMLLSHTSSLTDDAEYIIPANETVRQRVANPKAWDAKHAPGKWFRYTNLNFPVIASVLETATGERFDKLMHRLVFAPNGIDACFNWATCSDDAIQRAVVMRRENGEVRGDDLKGKRPDCPVYRGTDGSCDIAGYKLGDNGGMFSPQGGVRISMRNLAKLGGILAQQHKRMMAKEIRAGILNPSSAQLPGESEKGFYCRYVRTIHIIGASRNSVCKDDLFGDGKVRIGHGGEAYGVRSGLWVDPKTGKGIAFFTTAVPDTEPAGFSAFTSREERVVLTKSAKGGK